jgi:hypothetical protein
MHQPSPDSHWSGHQPLLEMYDSSPSKALSGICYCGVDGIHWDRLKSPSLYLLIRGHAQPPSVPPPESPGREYRQPERESH